MKHGPVFSAVDFLTLKHGVDPLPQAGFVREFDKELHRLVGDAILRVIEIDARRFGCQTSATLSVIREQISQMQRARLLTMRFEVLPAGPPRERAICEWFYDCCHFRVPFYVVVRLSKTVFGRLECCSSGAFSQSRNPPRKALALSPARQFGGNFSSCFALPPPRTTSSGSSAAMR